MLRREVAEMVRMEKMKSNLSSAPLELPTIFWKKFIAAVIALMHDQADD